MREGMREAGAEAGTSPSDAGARGGCPGGESCERVVFVTSRSFLTADIGGLTGADKMCTAMATLSRNPRVRDREFVAWLSDDRTSPLKRMVHSKAPYVRPDGTTIARSFAALTSGEPLEEPISLDENGDDAARPSVWTGTGPLGDAVGGNCEGWTGGGTLGNKGQAGTRSRWTTTDAAAGLPTACAVDDGRIYCFEK